LRCWTEAFESLYNELQPINGSRPIMVLLPHPTDQANHFLIIGIEPRRFFQMLEATRKWYETMRSQKITYVPLKYLFKTELPSPKSNNPLQHDFAARDCANQVKFQMPQPPRDLVLAILFQLAKWKPTVFLAPFHMNPKIICCILLIIDEETFSKLRSIHEGFVVLIFLTLICPPMITIERSND